MIINLATLLTHLRARGINPRHITVQVNDSVLTPIHRLRFMEQNLEIPEIEDEGDEFIDEEED